MSSIVITDKNIIYSLYNSHLHNPPFFKKIIIQTNNLTHDDLKKIYNMCLLHGSIHFPNSYHHFFNSSNMITKKNNFIYTFPKKRIIEFIIMGVQKGGTTSLSLNISKHPNIFMNNNPDPRISEVHFFDLNWQKGIEWYKKQFNYTYKLVGDKTPSLLYLPSTFPLIQSVNPFVKLLIILRNPVERAFSAWKMNKKNKTEHRSFEAAILYELKNLKHINRTFYTISNQYISRGLYYQQIKELEKWFPKQNILILISEKVKEDMTNQYDQVYQFLNLPSFHANYQLEHVSNNQKIPNKLYKKLLDYYKKDIEKLEKHLRIKTNWL